MSAVELIKLAESERYVAKQLQSPSFLTTEQFLRLLDQQAERFCGLLRDGTLVFEKASGAK